MSKQSLAPAWMRSLSDICWRGLDTATHDKGAVVCIAVLGQEGFDLRSADNMQELDPEAVVTALLEGHAMASAAGLLGWLKQATVELRAATDLPEDAGERAAQLRMRADSAIRGWLRSVMMYAGDKYQHGEDNDDVLGAVCQVVGLWGGIADGSIAVQTPATNEMILELKRIRDVVHKAGIDIDELEAQQQEGDPA